MKLKTVDWLILIAMYENPDRTTEEILEEMRKLTDESYSIATVSRHIRQLKEEKIVSYAQANIDLRKIGLEMHFFLLIPNEQNKEENIKLLELFFDAHPYTIYRNMVFGDINGMFAMFVLPSDLDSLRYLIHAFDVLKDEYRIISSYEVFPEVQKLDSSRGNISYWNLETKRWNFDPERLRGVFDQPVIKTPLKELSSTVLHKLNMYDIILIRELTRNTLRSQKEILDDMLNKYGAEYSDERKLIDRSQQTISRHLKLLKEEGIYRGSELFINSEHFGLFIQALYIIEYETLEVSQLLKAVEIGAIPFPNSIYQGDHSIFLWLQLPPKDFAEINRIFFEKFSKIRVMVLGPNPMRYYLWHRNYDPQGRQWKSSLEWIATEPLQALQNSSLFPVDLSIRIQKQIPT